MMQQTLVLVAAHADDAELNAGGFMARWVAEGGALHIVMATNNCSGAIIPPDGDERNTRRHGPAETAVIRNREQAEAAAVVGATVHHLGYPQRHYWDGQREVSVGYDSDTGPAPDPHSILPNILIAANEKPAITRLADLLEKLAPDLVLTQTPFDIDPEHHAVASLVWQAVKSRPALLRAPLRFWTPSSGSPGGMVNLPYDQIIDITPHFACKVQLCACHASQWTAKRHTIVMDRAGYWGRKIGVKYAEPFITAHWAEM